MMLGYRLWKSWERRLLFTGLPELLFFAVMLLMPVSPPDEKQLGKLAHCPHSSSWREKQN
jgi:hypothetical protein